MRPEYQTDDELIVGQYFMDKNPGLKAISDPNFIGRSPGDIGKAATIALVSDDHNLA
jgi:hypothetical protein